MKRPKNLVVNVIVFILGITVGMAIVTLMKGARPTPIVIVPPEPSATPIPTVTPGPMQIFVNGAVAAPDIYALPPGSRVEEAIHASGGFTAQANTAVINLAQPLQDGMQVYVPAQGEEVVALPGVVGVIEENAPVDVASRTGAGIELLIDINSATADELESLPGVGPSTAQKIIDFREANGSFAAIEAIMQVPGIGEGKFNEMQAFISIGN